MYIFDNVEYIFDNAVYILDNVESVHDNVENRLHLHRSRNRSQWFATEPAKIKEFRCGTVQIQLRSATSQCVSHEKTTAGLPQRQGCIAPESVESISNTIKKETEVSLGLIIFVLL